jgi:hypothetical protein
MATDNRMGFQPARHLTGGQIRTRRYFVSTTAQAIAIGDAVRFNPNGDGVVAISGDSTPVVPVLGAVVACYDTNNKPLTFSQPTRGPYLQATVGGFVDVVDDPNVTFIVQCDGTVQPNHVGRFVSVTAAVNVLNTAAGTSQMQVRISTVDTSVRQFQIIGIAPNEDAGLGSILNRGAFDVGGGVNTDVEVRIAAHAFGGSLGTSIPT